MTIIKKLTAKGFKSFAKKTEVVFGENFNCILGPNGNGKSNVVDAICFVLGKSSAKGLRAEKSANLIYNGGKKGSPAKEAEVSIYFDNTNKSFAIEDKEVKVTRKVQKSGNSKYYINDKPRTRQQVLEILGTARIDPDGHNIVLQGDIARFMDMKGSERREIIEEIAGISIFEEKKEKAMSELNKVQEKINEADIILTEREKTLKDLKKDRDQAIQYKELEKNIERNKATRINLQLKDKQEKLDVEEKKFSVLEKEISKIQEEINLARNEVQERKKEIDTINNELNEKGDKRQRELASEIETLKTNIIKQSSRKDVIENELKKLKERKKSLQDSLNEADTNIKELKLKRDTLIKNKSTLKSSQESIEKEIVDYKKEHGIQDKEDISKTINEIENKIEDKQRQLLDAEEKKQQFLREKDKIEYELNTLNSHIEKIQGLQKEDKEKLIKLKENREEFKEVTKKLSNSLNESSVFSVQLATARERLSDSNDEYTKLRTRSIGIKEAAAGDYALRKIKDSNIPGVYGTVADLGQVDSKYSMALEVAAGARLRSVVVSTDIIAEKCIQMLKDSKSGVVTFLPLNKLKEKVIPQEIKKLKSEPGVQGLAIDLVKYDSKFSNVFKYVFAGTLVIDSLTTARKLGIGRSRMVTLEGDLIEVSGAMVGGYRRKTGLGFQEKEVNSGITRLEKDISRLHETVSLLEKKKFKNDEEIIQLRERKAVLEVQIKAAEVKFEANEDEKDLIKKKKELEFQLKDRDKEISNYTQDTKSIQIELERIKQQRTQFTEKLSKLTNNKYNEDLSKLEEQRSSIREQIIKSDSEVTSFNNQIEMYNKEKDKTQQILKSNEKEDEEFKAELKELSADLSGNNDILKIKEQNQKKFYSEYQGLFKKRTKLEKEIQSKDTNLIRNEERIRSQEGKRNDVTIKKAVLSGEVEGLKKEYEQYEQVQLRRNISLEDLNAEIKNFEHLMKNLGNVNLRALEIYEKVHEEYKALLEKHDKLKSEKEDVLKLMYEVELKKKESFMKTYNMLERNFKEIFSSLSTKGDAELIIEDPENIFESGVDIRVKIGSSRYLDIKGLSGGEKTLAALSFIFAIQEFEPSWFYLMDEVDAALDKRNSELLSKLINKYAKGAQYIVISHNDSIIGEADVIYGVSMQEGMSKVVSLKI
ncbi:MAG: chromosome segregation protein SMC [archaeon]